MKDGNLVRWIEELAGGETIIGVVFGEKGRWAKPKGDSEPINKLMSWDAARPYLSYDFNSGYGGADCHPVYAWTETKIIAIHEYDGSTCAISLPRNPEDCTPSFT